MVIPNFLIIGAAKSGTTALYRYMKQHPDIYMPDRKEPHYFSYNKFTKNTEGPGDYIRNAIVDEEEYYKLFSNVKNEKAIGEASPSYLYVSGTAQRIYSKLPNVKIISILRNPADRAFSAYMHLIRDGHEQIFDFKEALDKENERIELNWGPLWHYKKLGLYFEQLKPYYYLFGKENILVIIYDDYIRDPDKLNKEIFQFLEIDDNFVPDMSTKPNVSGLPKSKPLQQLMSFFFDNENIIRTISRKLLSEEIRWRFTSNLRNKNLVQLKMLPETRNQLIEYYKEDITNLQQLIDYDLSHWLENK